VYACMHKCKIHVCIHVNSKDKMYVRNDGVSVSHTSGVCACMYVWGCVLGKDEIYVSSTCVYMYMYIYIYIHHTYIYTHHMRTHYLYMTLTQTVSTRN
jgi:hypothetical protein